jgi:aromatic-L-amino-acid decarboxylase
MNIAELEGWGSRIGAWSRRYLESLRRRPVRAQTKPGAVAAVVPDEPPEAPEAMEAIFADFETIVMPGMTHWQHPRFFAYFPANSSPPSVIAEWLTATLAAQCMLWQTSPAATELETRMLDWLRQMIGLPVGFHGVIQDSASSATLAALLVAREKALGFAGNARGLSGSPPLRVYASSEAHSSIDKASWIAGIGGDNVVRLVAKGPLRGMDANELEAAVLADREKGILPAAVVASIGGTATGGSDDVAALAVVARRHNLYLHVDAAWAGSAMICPEFRHLMRGAEAADSFVFNPHKWLLTNFDCSAHFVRDPESLVRTLAIRPSYLATHGRDGIINYSEWSIPLGRRFRALKLWFVIRNYGVEALRMMIRRHVALAEGMAARLAAEPDFEIVTEPVLALFTFRYRPAGAADLDSLNLGLIQAINDDGRIYLTPATVDGKAAIRFQVGQGETDRTDVEEAFAVITSLARGI